MAKKTNRKAAAARAKKYFQKSKSRGLRRLSIWVCAENTGFFDAVRRLDLGHPLTERLTEADWIAIFRAQGAVSGQLGAGQDVATEVVNVVLNTEVEGPGSVAPIADTSDSKMEVLGAGCGEVPIHVGEKVSEELATSAISKTDDADAPKYFFA
jgi:hypothetical protein